MFQGSGYFTWHRLRSILSVLAAGMFLTLVFAAMAHGAASLFLGFSVLPHGLVDDPWLGLPRYYATAVVVGAGAGLLFARQFFFMSANEIEIFARIHQRIVDEDVARHRD